MKKLSLAALTLAFSLFAPRAFAHLTVIELAYDVAQNPNDYPAGEWARFAKRWTNIMETALEKADYSSDDWKKAGGLVIWLASQNSLGDVERVLNDQMISYVGALSGDIGKLKQLVQFAALYKLFNSAAHPKMEPYFGANGTYKADVDALARDFYAQPAATRRFNWALLSKRVKEEAGKIGQ